MGGIVAERVLNDHKADADPCVLKGNCIQCFVMANQTLETASEVIDTLGGTTAVARLAGRKAQHVTNWRASGRLPADTFLIMKAELDTRGMSAPSSLWGIVEPTKARESA